MINKKTLLSLIITPFLSSFSYAYFCPNGFNQINVGDSITQVEQQCGKPDKKILKDAPDNTPQEWSYFIPQTGSPNMMTQSHVAQGTLKTSFAFDAEGKVMNITVNGVGVGATSNCGSNVSLGDSKKSVESACGTASLINKQGPATSSGSSSTVKDETNSQVELTYGSVTLVFLSGKLT